MTIPSSVRSEKSNHAHGPETPTRPLSNLFLYVLNQENKELVLGYCSGRRGVAAAACKDKKKKACVLERTDCFK